MLETDVAVDAEFMSSLAKIVQDGGPVHDRPRAFPRAERVAEREHVGIGADAGKAKKVPGAAHVRASFKDYIALARTAGLQTVAGSDAGEAGTDDHDVEVLHGHGSDAIAVAGRLCHEVGGGEWYFFRRNPRMRRKLHRSFVGQR